MTDQLSLDEQLARFETEDNMAKQRPRARRTDPGTSHAAADSVAELPRMQAAVLRALRMLSDAKGRAVTDEELVDFYMRRQLHLGRLPMQSESGIRTRRKELSDKGLLEQGPDRRLKTRRMGRTWRPKS